MTKWITCDHIMAMYYILLSVIIRKYQYKGCMGLMIWFHKTVSTLQFCTNYHAWFHFWLNEKTNDKHFNRTVPNHYIAFPVFIHWVIPNAGHSWSFLRRSKALHILYDLEFCKLFPKWAKLVPCKSENFTSAKILFKLFFSGTS